MHVNFFSFFIYFQLHECHHHTYHRKYVDPTFMRRYHGSVNHPNHCHQVQRRPLVHGVVRLRVHKTRKTKSAKRYRVVKVVGNTCSHFHQHRQKTRHLTQYKPVRQNIRPLLMRSCIRLKSPVIRHWMGSVAVTPPSQVVGLTLNRV